MNEQRRAFVARALARGANLSALCREFGITRKTGRLWRERARAEGTQALREHSRRPLCSPRRLQEEEVCQLVILKSAWPHWGPKKIAQLYRESTHQPLSVATCHRVLKACGLVVTRKLRVRRPATVRVAAVTPRQPNDVWTIDFKGWWRTRDGRRCEPLTVRDAFSRYVLSAYVPADACAATIQAEMDRLFRSHGLPKVIKSDNGRPFACVRSPLGLSRLSAGWVALGRYLPRLVNSIGAISYRGTLIHVSTVFSGWHVGLRIRDELTAEVWFNYLLVGTLNLQTMRFASAPNRCVKTHGLAA